MEPIHTSDEQFEADVLNNEKPVLLDFWAEWCGPCRALAPKLDEIAKEWGDQVVVAKMNIDQNQKTPADFAVRGIPTLILFKDGKNVAQISGNQPKDKIAALLSENLG